MNKENEKPSPEDQEDYDKGIEALERNEPTISLEELEKQINSDEDRGDQHA